MLSIIFCCAALFAVSTANPTGAPLAACDTMTPGPSDHGMTPQDSEVPWEVTVTPLNTNGTYTPGQEYTITLTAKNKETLRGFFIQGRTALQNSMVGTFADPTDNTNARLSSCTTPAVGVTHNNEATAANNNEPMDLSGPFSFKWTAPAAGTGPIQFRYTIVHRQMTWWDNGVTRVIQEAGREIPMGNAACKLQGIGFYTLFMLAIAAAVKTVM